RKGIHNCEIYYCDYVIDTYMLVYGNADLVTYSATELKNWIDNGWCEYDYKVGPESFVKLSDECPIDEVADQTVLSVTKKLSSIQGRGWNYHKLGYDKMPKFIMGTDGSGFDLFKRCFAGLRTSLLLGVCTAAFCFAFGLVWGAVSGYFGGNVDLFMERFCEILGGIPWIVVMTLCILHMGNNFKTFTIALCLTGWMGTAARTRTQFYRFKGREYVLASRTLGSSDMRLIFKHILPNSMGTIITASVFMITSVIFSEATLAYLNLGLQGVQSFGVEMASNQQYLGIYPYLVIFPAVILSLLMITNNLFGNGLRDAFNPSLKGSE
ncbi:MAG: ABC transporter permease, partial [Lachnospiraceae bacterium]|nr:ABC transporter permease [Lachnospiraceae bacterium]